MENLVFQPSSQEFVWIRGEKGAREFPQKYGTTQMYFEVDEPIFYARTVDMSGNTTAFETFDYTKRAKPVPPTYATTEDLGALIQQMNSMQKMLEELTAPTTKSAS